MSFGYMILWRGRVCSTSCSHGGGVTPGLFLTLIFHCNLWERMLTVKIKMVFGPRHDIWPEGLNMNWLAQFPTNCRDWKVQYAFKRAAAGKTNLRTDNALNPLHRPTGLGCFGEYHGNNACVHSKLKLQQNLSSIVK